MTPAFSNRRSILYYGYDTKMLYRYLLKPKKKLNNEQLILYCTAFHSKTLKAENCTYYFLLISAHFYLKQKINRWKADLKLRIVQHNIRTVASYYKQINTKRLAELLGLEEDQAERNVAGACYLNY